MSESKVEKEGKREDEEGDKTEKEKNTVFQMFQMVVVNSYGTQDIKKLPNDDYPLKLTSE